MWKIIAGIGGLLILFGALAATQPKLALAALPTSNSVKEESANLDQALQALRVTLALLEQNLASLNLSAKQAEQLSAALAGIRVPLLALSDNLKASAIAQAATEKPKTAAAPTVAVNTVQSESEEKPLINIVADETAAISETGDAEALAALAETETTAGSGNSKNIALTVFIALALGWIIYYFGWRKKAAPQTQSEPTAVN